jgi:hypothetical protein
MSFEGEEGQISLARCRDAECPMKRRRTNYVVPVVAALLVTGLTIGGAALGLSLLTREPTKLEESAKRRAVEMEAEKKSRAAMTANAVIMAKPAPNGGSGIVTPSSEPVGTIATRSAKPGEGQPMGRAAVPKPAGPSAPAGPAPPVNAAAAARVTTFACTGKLSAGRALVCSDPGLAISDYNLSLLFDAVLATRINRAALRRSQDEWKAGLDRIGNDRQRVQAHYRRRFDELSLIQAGVR